MWMFFPLFNFSPKPKNDNICTSAKFKITNKNERAELDWQKDKLKYKVYNCKKKETLTITEASAVKMMAIWDGKKKKFGNWKD